jgi:predicted flap endonuclease-1-like 5' DNA nuclease
MARSTSPTTTKKPRASRAKPKVEATEPIEPKKPAQAKTQAKPEAAEPQERKQREVGPATQAVIDRILDLRKQGLGYPSICKALNEEGVKTFKGGATWHPPVVRGICMRNGVERGTKAS